MKNVTNNKKCLACKQCCVFINENDRKLSPYLSAREYKNVIFKGRTRKERNNFYQVKTLKSRVKESKYVCTFLNEKNHKCAIYKNRPIDCMIWPFVISYGKHVKHKTDNNIYLCIVKKSWCPLAEIKKNKKLKIVDDVINFIKKKKIDKEILEGKRYVWPYKSYHIKLRRIT